MKIGLGINFVTSRYVLLHLRSLKIKILLFEVLQIIYSGFQMADKKIFFRFY